MQKGSSVCHIQKQSFGQGWCLCCVCSWAQPLLLPLAKCVCVCVCAGKLVAYLCRAARDQQVVSEPYRFACVAGLIAGDGNWLEEGRQQRSSWRRQCCWGCPATTGGRCAHGAGSQRHQLVDADSHQLWQVGGDHEGQAQSPTALECHLQGHRQ
jgi:hypothetical protein